MTWNGANFVQSCGRSSAMRRVNCRVESSGITGTKETASGHNITPEVATQTPSLGGQPIPLATHEPSAEISEGIGRSQVTLRQWLSRLGRPVDRVESLHIFKQVLEFVELAHAQGVILRTIRPSCLLLSPLNRVTFIDSTSSRSSSDHSGNHSCRNESPDLEARVMDGVQERSQAQSVVNQSVTATGSSVQNTGLNSTQQVNSQQEVQRLCLCQFFLPVYCYTSSYFGSF
jgi:serine/threonine protein kinase